MFCLTGLMCTICFIISIVEEAERNGIETWIREFGEMDTSDTRTLTQGYEPKRDAGYFGVWYRNIFSGSPLLLGGFKLVICLCQWALAIVHSVSLIYVFCMQREFKAGLKNVKRVKIWAPVSHLFPPIPVSNAVSVKPWLVQRVRSQNGSLAASVYLLADFTDVMSNVNIRESSV